MAYYIDRKSYKEIEGYYKKLWDERMYSADLKRYCKECGNVTHISYVKKKIIPPIDLDRIIQGLVAVFIVGFLVTLLVKHL